MSGKLITLEGLDGSGKATQTELLCKELAGKGIRVRKISFPDYGQPSSALAKMYLDGKFGENPEDVSAYAASSFYAVDRFASYTQFWKEDYQSGAVIVADRYSTSNIVFQMSKLPRDEWDAFIQWVQDYEYNKLGLPKPDCTVYLDMPPSVSQKLLSGRYHGDERKKDIHERNTVYLRACRESAAYAAKMLGWLVINCAEGDNAKPMEQIHRDLMKELAGEINLYV